MTGLEPHPIFRLPSREQALALEGALGREAAAQRMNVLIEQRRHRMELEKDDPYSNGFRPDIWGLIDDLLCDGKRVCLVDYPSLLPKDFAKSESAELELTGHREILLHGANGASKSEYAAWKLSKVLREIEAARTWAFHETGPESISRQQPLFYKYLPKHIREIVDKTGRYKRGRVANVSYSQKGGFTEANFVLDNASQIWFKNYAQEEQTVEGEQCHAIWLDELCPLTLVRTVRFRLVRHKGLLIVTFTPIKGWTATVQEYSQGAKTLLEVEADRLPIKDSKGKPTGKFEKVPRVQAAGPGTEGNLKANIVYLHSDDNPYFDKTELTELLKGARRQLILERGYGVATKAFANQFPKFDKRVHVVKPDRIPREGTNYLIVDPVAGRNWFMLYMRIHPDPVVRPDGNLSYRRTIYREWPSTDHEGLSAYVPGVGDPGPWALPGNAADGERGPAQDALGWGLDRYKTEILRLEGAEIKKEELRSKNGEQTGGIDLGGEKLRRFAPKNSLVRRGGMNSHGEAVALGEVITERLMDSRYGAKPTQLKERTTSLLEQMSDIGMEFLAASGKDISEGVQMINDALDYDDEVAIGDYSPSLARINLPLLQISEECPNLIYSLQEWTNKDKQEGACKDPIDCLRYGFEHDLQYIGTDAYAWGKY